MLKTWIPGNIDLHDQGLTQSVWTNSNVTVVDGGKIGKCLYFDGSTSTHLSATGYSLGNNWSYGFWFKGEASRSWETLATLNSTGGDSDMQIGMYTNTNSNVIQSTANGQWNASISFTKHGEWHHYFCTFDGASMLTYVDGVLVNTKAITSALLSRTILSIGGRRRGDTSYDCAYKGYMNDFRLYDHALSPREVAEIAKGLVLHYPLGDSYIEGTTNLYATLDGVTTGCYNGATGKYGYGANTDIYKTTGTFNGKNSLKIYMGTSGASARPYVYFGNLFTSNGTNAPEYKTLSFDYYGTIGTYINFYKLGSGSGTGTWRNVTTSSTGTFTNSGNVTVVPNQWNHIELVLHGTTDANAEWGYGILGNTHTSNTANYWLFANVQLETKDHATGFANYGTTRAGGEVYDTSGYGYNGTTNGTFTVSSNTARCRFSTIFNGSTNAIQIPFNTMIGTELTDYSISVWFYKESIGTKNYQTIFGGPSGYELEARVSSGSDPLIKLYSWGGGQYAYQFNVWNHLVFVQTTTEVKCYLNGELVISGGTPKANPSGNYFIGSWSSATGQNFEGQMSDFRIYATALTADQVKQLYEAPISLANNGTLFANEFNET